MNELKNNEMLVLAAIKQPEVFAASWKQFNDEKKHWIENPETFVKLGKIYGFDWYDIERNIPLEKLNERETGDTIVWDKSKQEFKIGRRARDIYYPVKVCGCRAYLNHRQVIPCRERTKIELDVISYGTEMFEKEDHSIRILEDGRYIIIGETWYDLGAIDGGMYSVIVAKNGKPESKDALIERDDMCADNEHKDIQPHGIDILPLEKGDRISLWTVFYFGGPCELKTAHTQNFLTVQRLLL